MSCRLLSLSALLLSLAGCVSVPVLAEKTAEPEACYQNSCCAHAPSLAFAPHRLRCEGVVAEKTSLLAEAEKHFSEAARQARNAAGEAKGAGQQVLCLSLIDSARVADTRGDLERAQARYAEAVKTCSASFGKDGEEAARARIGLANVRIDSGRIEEANAELQALVETSRQQQNKGLQAAALDALGRAEDRRGEHSKARTLLKQALELRQQVSGERSLDTALTMMHLGDNAMLLHGWNDARGWYLRAQAGIEESQGKRSHYYVSLKTALAASYLRDRRFEALPALYEELLILSRDVYGASSEEYAGTLNDAGAFLYMQHRFAPAFERFRQAAEIRRRTMPGSLLLGWTSLNAAKARLEFDHCGIARPLLLEAQDILRQQKQAGSTDAELPEFGNEFGRVAQLCAARPEPALARSKSGKSGKKR